MGQQTTPLITVTNANANADKSPKWNAIQHLCYNNPLHASRPYQCVYHFDGGGQCSKFLDPKQRERALLIIKEISTKDLRDVTEPDRERMLRQLLCPTHREKAPLKRELRRTQQALEKALTHHHGPYETRWKVLHDGLWERHGNLEDEYTWVRWIALDVLPSPMQSDLKGALPWPVRSGKWQDVTAENVRTFYEQTMWSHAEKMKKELYRWKFAEGFLVREMGRWEVVWKVFGALKRWAGEEEEGFHVEVAECVECIFGIVEGMVGEITRRRGVYCFDEGGVLLGGRRAEV